MKRVLFVFALVASLLFASNSGYFGNDFKSKESERAFVASSNFP